MTSATAATLIVANRIRPSSKLCTEDSSVDEDSARAAVNKTSKESAMAELAASKSTASSFALDRKAIC